MNRILLIDGNSLVYRAFYGSAYGPGGILTNSQGFPVNAIITFNWMLTKAIKNYTPTHIFVAFDAGKQTFRHEKLESYKAGRNPTPPELIAQFPKVKEMLNLMGIRSFEIKNIEADDIIGTLSLQYSNHSNVIVLSSDKDLHQLVKERVTVAAPQNGSKPDKILDDSNFFIETGIEPWQVPDLKGIVGDASDNLPGIKGIGNKGAIKLLETYKTLENVYKNKADLSLKMVEKLEASADIAFLCKELATLKYDVAVPFEFADLLWTNSVTPELIEFFTTMEMNSLVKKYEGTTKTTGQKPKKPAKDSGQLSFDKFLF